MSHTDDPIAFRTPALLGALRELVQFATALEIAEPDDADWSEAQEDFAPRVLRILEGAVGVFESFLQLYEDEGGIRDTETEPEQTCDQIRKQVADRAFIAKMEMSHWKRTLAAPASGDAWILVGRCNQAIGAFIKAAVSLEAVGCEVVGQKRVLKGMVTVEQCIELRRAYLMFRQAVEVGGEPEDDQLVARIQAASDHILVLLNSSIRKRIRLADRCQLINIEKRSRQWIGHGLDADLTEGRHIWQDMHSIAELMMQINRREELVTHDRDTVRALLHRLRGDDVPEFPAEVWQRELKSLLGRNRDLDLIAEDPHYVDAETLSAILEAVYADLAVSGSATASAGRQTTGEATI